MENAKVLKKYDYDFEKAVANEPNTILTPGSEFWHMQNIEKIWQSRENWAEIHLILTEGVKYSSIEGQTEEIRRDDLKLMVESGNHKSANNEGKFHSFAKITKKEVKQAFTFPITMDCLFELKGAAVIPIGVHEQYTINKLGQRIMKHNALGDAYILYT